MKIISVEGSRYYIQSRDDMISLTHELARKGYKAEQIANLLDISVRTVRQYLSECW